MTLRERLERGLLPLIRELRKRLVDYSTVRVLTHYQMLLHAAFDKAKLPDGFWAKWRYVWALSLERPYTDSNAANADFTAIDRLVEQVFDIYVTGAIFERGANPGAEKEFLARLGLALSVREPDLLGFPEQIKSWSSDRLKPFNDSYFQPQFEVRYEQVLEWLDSLIQLLQTRLDAWLKDLHSIAADMKSLQAQASIQERDRRMAELRIKERLNANDAAGEELHIFTSEELRVNLSGPTIQKLKGLLSVVPGDIRHEYVFPHDPNPLEYGIFVALPANNSFFIDPASAYRISAKAFEKAILASAPLRDRYLTNRDKSTERRVEEALRNPFPTAAFYRNYYPEKGQLEKDLLLHDGENLLIVESKNSKIRNFNGTADDLLKFDRDFEHSVQFCYEQANDIKQRIIHSGEEITFLDQKGKKYFSLKKSEIKQIFILCVTIVPRGPFGTDMSLQLKKLANEPFPLAMSMFDLETICKNFSGKQFVEYLLARSKLHGRVHTGDELNFAGYFLKFGHLNLKDGTHVADDFSGIFDRRWHRDKGIDLPEPTNPPVETGITRRGSRIVIDKNDGKKETIQIAPDIYEHVTGRPVVKMKGSQRNKPCHCGSGRKLKHCHGRP